jgi:hypothetical protein
MSVALDSMSAPLCHVERTENKFKGADFRSRKCKKGYTGAYGGIWRSLRLARVWSQAVGFALVHLAGIWFQAPLSCIHINSFNK